MERDIANIRAAKCTIGDRTAFLSALRDVARAHNTHIICFNADMVAGQRHVQSAIEHAVRSCEEGTAISNTLEMEALLYASGSRQCNIGSSFGIHDGENRLFVCCSPCTGEEVFHALESSMIFVPVESWNTIDREKQAHLKELFDITDEELQTLEDPDQFIDLVLERVALLDVMR